MLLISFLDRYEFEEFEAKNLDLIFEYMDIVVVDG